MYCAEPRQLSIPLTMTHTHTHSLFGYPLFVETSTLYGIVKYAMQSTSSILGLALPHTTSCLDRRENTILVETSMHMVDYSRHISTWREVSLVIHIHAFARL